MIESTARDDVLRNDIYDRPPRFSWGQGLVTLLGDAVEDGVILANELANALSLSQGLRDYEARRHPRTRKFVNQSRMFTALAHGQYRWARLVRATVFRWLPSGFKNRQFQKMYKFEI